VWIIVWTLIQKIICKCTKGTTDKLTMGETETHDIHGKEEEFNKRLKIWLESLHFILYVYITLNNLSTRLRTKRQKY